MNRFKKEKYISQRQRGNEWQFQVQIYIGKDKPIRKSFNSSNYFDASEAYRAAIAFRDDTLFRLRKGMFNRPQDITVEEALNKSFSVLGIRERTQQANLHMLNKYMAKYKDMTVQSITSANVMECLSEAAKIASQDTLKRIMTAWHRVAKTAMLSDWISRDFTFGLKLPESQVIVIHRDASTDFETLKKVCESLETYGLHSGADHYNNQIIIYALYTMYYLGLRPSETFALGKQDIDLKAERLSINKELGSSATDMWVLRPCKNETSVRVLPIPPELIPILEQAMAFSKHEGIFMNKRGKYMNTTAVAAKLRNISGKLGIDFRMYQLRHQFSTDLIVGGADLRTVQELMGHADATMTIKYARSNELLKKKTISERKEQSENKSIVKTLPEISKNA